MAFLKRHPGELFPGPLDANNLGTTIAKLNRREWLVMDQALSIASRCPTEVSMGKR